MEKNNRCIVCALFLMGILSACGSGASSPPDQGASPTAAATAAGQTPSPVVPSPTSESNPEPQESPVSPAEELSPNPTQAFTGKIPLCNDSLFVDDVTIPDGTVLAPEEKFVKTWKFKNFGACQWTTSYAIGFAYGDAMSGTETKLPISVGPGATVDIPVTMIAPKTAGWYGGWWRLKDASGDYFGDFVYVSIQVSGGQ
jgi:hypothetical protein